MASLALLYGIPVTRLGADKEPSFLQKIVRLVANDCVCAARTLPSAGASDESESASFRFAEQPVPLPVHLRPGPPAVRSVPQTQQKGLVP